MLRSRCLIHKALIDSVYCGMPTPPSPNTVPRVATRRTPLVAVRRDRQIETVIVPALNRLETSSMAGCVCRPQAGLPPSSIREGIRTYRPAPQWAAGRHLLFARDAYLAAVCARPDFRKAEAPLHQRWHLLYRHLGSVAETTAFSRIQKPRLCY
jgi:hypothetical protein